ncbi:alpha/beta hydrolase [Planotetraspora phitsanulokensis]|uniref:Alpha/beta hydrolase n=1 Tax=Planotetraspora phitsanulokensis TaxID=575192 RepID=A0A8J3U677_9ACTN|nr:alpha/beta hydrolase [Planotetraspora phitsanulokensis]GII38891.1 alpha/beta hydrolase [Planotetraspora phitsanulokensis]
MKRSSRITGLVAALAGVAALSSLVLSPGADAHSTPLAPKPTVVLVHGAWADAAGWTPVAESLEKDGYTVKAPPNPLRSLTSDAQYISSVLQQIKGPVILVAHSYGGAVITNAAVGNPNVKALVYIAAFAPDKGDSLASLNARPVPHPIAPVPALQTTYPKPDGSAGTELTIDPAQYSNVFLDNQLPKYEAQAFAAEQRPLSLDSVTETTGTPAWKSIPSWYMVAKDDRAISPDLERFMASRAHAHTVEESGPHLIMFTNPAPVTHLIEQAATATVH